jgi:hypothetical protein
MWSGTSVAQLLGLNLIASPTEVPYEVVNWNIGSKIIFCHSTKVVYHKILLNTFRTRGPGWKICCRDFPSRDIILRRSVNWPWKSIFARSNSEYPVHLPSSPHSLPQFPVASAPSQFLASLLPTPLSLRAPPTLVSMPHPLAHCFTSRRRLYRRKELPLCSFGMRVTVANTLIQFMMASWASSKRRRSTLNIALDEIGKQGAWLDGGRNCTGVVDVDLEQSTYGFY